MLREKIKNWKMELAAVLVFVLVLGMTGLSGSVKAADQTDLKTIDIMFVHDTHSHLNSFSTVVDEKQEMIGGFARIKTLIDEQKEKDPDTLPQVQFVFSRPHVRDNILPYKTSPLYSHIRLILLQC